MIVKLCPDMGHHWALQNQARIFGQPEVYYLHMAG
jgi:hypothetical protein